jgi:hypothetical protein
MLFLKLKKEDQTAKNFYSQICSENNWSFKGIPITKSVVIERIGLGTENIIVANNQVQATAYRVFDAEDIESKSKHEVAPNLRVYISKLDTIPYMIRSDDGIKIEIKYLNNLSKD